MRAIGILACLLVAVAMAVLLVTGSEWLDWELPFEFPAGNLIAAALLIAAAAIPVLMDVPGRALRVFARATLWAAIVWLPASLILAGGVRLSYAGWAGWLWIGCTLALLLAIPVAVAWAAVAALLARRNVAPR